MSKLTLSINVTDAVPDYRDVRMINGKLYCALTIRPAAEAVPTVRPSRRVYDRAPVAAFDRWRPETDETLMDLKGRGMTWRHIAHQLGRSISSVQNRWDKLKKATQPTGGVK